MKYIYVQSLSSAALWLTLTFIWLFPGVCYIQGLLEKSPADTFCCLSAAELTLILSGTNMFHRWGFYSARSLFLHQKSVVKIVKYMFSWIKYKNVNCLFSCGAPESRQTFSLSLSLSWWLGVEFKKTTALLRALDLLEYSPSTHEGRFLVVPATFPGRQEHLTVCDRSSMRFLLQHLWAAITSHVPPSDKGEEGRRETNQSLRGDQTDHISQFWDSSYSFFHWQYMA